jgi:hypothetical protein
MTTSRTNRGPPASESDPLLGRHSPTTSYDAAASQQQLLQRKRRRGIRRGPSSLVMCCTYCSCSCCVFLIWIGIYATWNAETGAWFHSGWKASETSTVQRNSFSAAGLFLIYFFITLAFWKDKNEWTIDRYEMELSNNNNNISRRDE